MIKFGVCKTVVSHPDKRRFVLHLETDPIRVRTFASLGELAQELRNRVPKSLSQQEPCYIKNDVPGNIIWVPDDTLQDRVLECERLSRDEVHELAQLLKQ